jgi:hypothetical protein
LPSPRCIWLEGPVIASEAKQSTAPQTTSWIASSLCSSQ